MAPRDPTHEMYDAACDLLEAARAIERSAGRGGVIEAIPATLGTLEETLQVLSASCYRLAGQCAPDVTRRRLQGSAECASLSSQWDATFSRESEALLMSTLHDVASRVARASHACRDGRETAAPLIARRLNWEHQIDGLGAGFTVPLESAPGGDPRTEQVATRA
jgi:hypothetical protein